MKLRLTKIKMPKNIYLPWIAFGLVDLVILLLVLSHYGMFRMGQNNPYLFRSVPVSISENQSYDAHALNDSESAPNSGVVEEDGKPLAFDSGDDGKVKAINYLEGNGFSEVELSDMHDKIQELLKKLRKSLDEKGDTDSCADCLEHQTPVPEWFVCKSEHKRVLWAITRMPAEEDNQDVYDRFYQDCAQNLKDRNYFLACFKEFATFYNSVYNTDIAKDKYNEIHSKLDVVSYIDTDRALCSMEWYTECLAKKRGWTDKSNTFMDYGGTNERGLAFDFSRAGQPLNDEAPNRYLILQPRPLLPEVKEFLEDLNMEEEDI